MKKFILTLILLYSFSCKSTQLKDQTVIDSNNKLIEEVKIAKSQVDTLNIPVKEKQLIQNTLSKCSEYSKDSNDVISKCNIRENKLNEKIIELKTKISIYFKILIGESIVLLLIILYLGYFKK